MVVTHFVELGNRAIVLSQLRNQLPSVNEQVKIKGRKGKVVNVYTLDGSIHHVEVEFEQVLKPSFSALENKKKKDKDRTYPMNPFFKTQW